MGKRVQQQDENGTEKFHRKHNKRRESQKSYENQAGAVSNGSDGDKSSVHGGGHVSDLLERLDAEDVFVQEILDTIPPQHYFDQEVKEVLQAEKHARTDEKLKGLRGNNKDMSKQMKHKRARLDPQQHKTVSQVQMELAEKEAREKVAEDLAAQSACFRRASNLEELQMRLRQRIQELQAKRKSFSVEDWREKKRIKKKMQKIRKKEREKHSGNTAKGKPNSFNGQIDSKPSNSFAEVKKPKPVFNKEGKMVFSKFDFSETGLKEKRKGKYSGKDYKKILHNVQKQQEKLLKVEAEDPSLANDIKEKKMWLKAVDRTEGIKVKDDPDLLKKAMKKREQQKRKSQKQWAGRQEHVQKMQKDRQAKRWQNIQARKREKLEKKIKRAKKKGRFIPGF